MQDEGWEMHIQSIAGALPIMPGDPRQLSEKYLRRYRHYADWPEAIEQRHGIMSFRQDLYGFGAPMEGVWDGFQRINTDSKNGEIVGVFRNGSVEENRIVLVGCLDPEKIYPITTLSGQLLRKMKGKEMVKSGFEVKLDQQYQGVLFEIAEAD